MNTTMLWVIVRRLRSDDETVRVRAVAELADYPAEQVVAYLPALLSDQSFNVRLDVVRTLGKLNHGSAIEPLFMALNNKAIGVREAAAEELSKFNSAPVVQRLVAKLSDDDPGVRRVALNMLENLKSEAAIQALSDNHELVEEIHRQIASREAIPQIDQTEKEILRAQQQEYHSKLNAATPRTYITYIIMGLNVAIFIVTVIAGAGLLTSKDEVLLKWGADFGPLTTYGEWWRLLTSAFLHFGILHLALNMLALFSVGMDVERLYGNIFFLVIYLASAIFSGLLSIAINGDRVISAGASGAIFGIFGAMLAFLLVQKREFPKSELKSLTKTGLTLVGYNIFYGLLRSGVDNAAHFGGVISGFLLGLLLARPLNLNLRKAQASKRLIIGVVGSVLAIVLICRALPKSSYSYRSEMAYGEIAHAFTSKDGQAVAELNDLLLKWRDGKLKETEVADKLESDDLAIWRDFNQRFSAVELTDKSPSFKLRKLVVDYTKTRSDGIQCLIEGLRTNKSEKFDCFKSSDAAAEKLVRAIELERGRK